VTGYAGKLRVVAMSNVFHLPSILPIVEQYDLKVVVVVIVVYDDDVICCVLQLLLLMVFLLL
jgi:hypothetical protein